MAGKEVATKRKTDVAAFDMSIFEEDAGVGNENITQDDLALPFLKILSGLDPLLDELEDARKGRIVCRKRWRQGYPVRVSTSIY